MKVYLLLTLTFFVFTSVSSQKIPIRTYDNKTKSFDSIIPVYREVNLKFEDPGKFDYILLVEHCPKKSLDDTLIPDDTLNPKETCKAAKELLEFSKEKFWKETIDSKKYLFIRLNQSEDGTTDSFLRPMKNYSLIFLKINPQISKIRREYAKAFLNVDFNEMKSIRQKYKKLRKSLSSLENLFSPEIEDFFEPIEMYLSEVDNRKKIQLKLTEKECLAKEIVSEGIMNVEEIYKENNYKDLKKFLFVIDSVQAKNLGIEVQLANKLIAKFSELNLEKINKMLVGEFGLIKKKEQKATLEDNIKNLKLVRKLLFDEQMLNETLTSQDLKLAFKDLESKMLENLEIQNKLEEIDLDIDKLILGINMNVYSGNSISTSTNINSFEKRIKLKFTPDIGLVNFGFQSGFNEVSPYLGFHFNFSYLDKDIPFNKLRNKTVWDRLSLSIGLALNSIEKEGKREGLIEGSSLLTGIGFRINHTFRIVGGGNIFYKTDESPISNQRKLAITPCAGISVDFEVKELLNGFSNVFKND